MYSNISVFFSDSMGNSNFCFGAGAPQGATWFALHGAVSLKRPSMWLMPLIVIDFEEVEFAQFSYFLALFCSRWPASGVEFVMVAVTASAVMRDCWALVDRVEVPNFSSHFTIRWCSYITHCRQAINQSQVSRARFCCNSLNIKVRCVTEYYA